MMTYTLYHVTNRAVADNILANGFTPGKRVQLANSPWMIGTKGDTAIKVVIDLDEELMSFQPGDRQTCQVHLPPESLNIKATLSILDATERDRLRQEFGTPGSPTMELPDFLKNLTVDDEPKIAFISVLLNDEASGIIVKEIAFFDDHLLKEVLQAYRPKAGRVPGFTASQIEAMTFDKKIKTLAGLLLGAESAALRDQAVTRMQPMRNIRNKAAHVAGLRRTEAEELYAEPENRQLLANFPHDFRAQCAEVQDLLQTLLTLPDFSAGSDT